MVFNGEIYNYPSLREDLESQGHRFTTDADTEVLVHLWEEYSERTPEYLNGVFAFAIWDDDQESLFLASDRLGIKPLYYTIEVDGFAFASELPACSSLVLTARWTSVRSTTTFRCTTLPGLRR